MLTAGEIAGMRATQAAALPDTCTVKKRTLTSDSAGGYTETWAARASNVACRLAPVRSSADTERLAGDAFRGRSLWQLTMAAGQVIEHTDRVESGGVTYDVVAVQSGGAWATATRALIARAD